MLTINDKCLKCVKVTDKLWPSIETNTASWQRKRIQGIFVHENLVLGTMSESGNRGMNENILICSRSNEWINFLFL